MRAVVFQHGELGDVGRLGPVLEQAGFSLVKRFRTVSHTEDVDADLVVVLGGLMGVYDAEHHPFLNQEIAVLAERLARGRPCLGVCLGSQMLAAAAGANVSLGKNGLEVGACAVRWSPEGLKDPVIAGVRPRTTVAQWHQDSFTPVPGATLLASTDRYPQQAFRLGSSYGFQFHLELDAATLDHWFTAWEDALIKHGKAPGQLRAQLPKLRATEGEILELLHRLARHFAGLARS